jgi:hypothetical protein
MATLAKMPPAVIRGAAGLSAARPGCPDDTRAAVKHEILEM